MSETTLHADLRRAGETGEDTPSHVFRAILWTLAK